MFRIFLIFFLFIFLSNCTITGSAFLGPALTGATTKSVAQASLSFGTGQIVRKIHNNHEVFKKGEQKDPIIISSYKIDDISLSEVLEEEPLP